MQIIKLDAINSTNNFLKQLASEKSLENFTVVVADEQTNGKGQMGSKWVSEKGKNLTMSVFVKDFLFEKEKIFLINIATVLAIKEVLIFFKLEDVSIKWPNDIMAGKKKICGILIENKFKHDNNIYSIIGVGLNINQKRFEDFPNATSMINEKNEDTNIDDIVLRILDFLKTKLDLIGKDEKKLWKEYHKNLFFRDKPIAFEDNHGNRFMAIIHEVSNDGRLNLLLEDDTIKAFGIKEIKFLF